MKRYYWGAQVLALWLGAAGAVCQAKPPDLPARADDRCEENGRPVCIDVWCPGVLPAVVQQLLSRPGLLPGVENTPTAQQARMLYELASRCAREGKLDEARACLRQAHLANPTCRFGQLAIQRLQELEATAPAEESSEPVSPRPQANPESSRHGRGDAELLFQQMRQATQPLGLVLGNTY